MVNQAIPDVDVAANNTTQPTVSPPTTPMATGLQVLTAISRTDLNQPCGHRYDFESHSVQTRSRGAWSFSWKLFASSAHTGRRHCPGRLACCIHFANQLSDHIGQGCLGDGFDD